MAAHRLASMMEQDSLRLTELLTATMPGPDASTHTTSAHRQLLTCLLEREVKARDRCCC